MQVVCGNCQLSFDAPDGATGLVCPICRGPLRPQAADGSAAGAAKTAQETAQEWSGGDLDDLIALVSAPALSARVEVLAPNADGPAGEVHLLAGGVSDALFEGKSTDDALDRLRAIKQARFRIEPRLPNPSDGNLGTPGPEAGTLESRALAHLMRYCEDYVITCSIEVWRGSENARVEYKRGEISGVTVGGIDAPERLAEVMQWSSGNYRLIVPPLKLPAVAPKRAQASGGTPAPVPAPALSAQAARQASATKTMFGIPIAEVTKAREAALAAAKSATTPAATPAPVLPTPAVPVPAASVATAKTLMATPSPAAAPEPAAAASATPAPMSVASTPMAVQHGSATRTIFGVPAPNTADGFVSGTTDTASRASKPTPPPTRPVGGPAPTEKDPQSAASRAEADRKTGARKVSVPAPDVSPPPAASAPSPAPAPVAVARAENTEPVKRIPTGSPAAVTRNETTEPVKRAPAVTPVEKSRPGTAPVLSWALVGVFFGAVFLAVYYFVGQLGH